MIRFLVTGDWHLKGTNPRNRVGSYKQAAFDKLREVFALAKEYGCQAIIQPGDVWDSPEVSDGVKDEYADLLEEAPCQILAASGNHDIYGYNLDTYKRTSLRAIERMVALLEVNRGHGFGISGLPAVDITFQPFTGRVDVDGWGYAYEWPENNRSVDYSGVTHIHVVHGMLLDHTPPFDKFTLLEDAKTNADIVITGHDHTGYGIYKRADGVTFINPGALLRSAASMSEIERPIQVALIEIRGKGDYDVWLLPVTCAKPGNEVLDRSKIEADQKRAYAMESFAALIQAETGERVLLNIDAIVEQIAASEKYDAAVVLKALERIAAERANV
jgi:exonuclease SbcD